MPFAPERSRILTVLGLLGCLLMPGRAGAQERGALGGRVIDERDGSPVSDATVVLRPTGSDTAGRITRRTTTARDGSYRFANLPFGRWSLAIERLGYRAMALEVTLDRAAPVTLSILAEPVPFPLDALAPGGGLGRGPSLVPASAERPDAVTGRRTDAERVRQERYLSSDVRQLGQTDVREANTLVEDDVLRAFQRVPGVAARDDYSADLWTRGAPAGQTAVLFDGIALVGPLHALGVLSGPSSDMLATATFQPGVASAALQGAGAAVVEVESRSPANAERTGSASLSPVSARLSVDGRPSERVAWAVGARRSYVDALSVLAGDITPGTGPIPYAFADLTARVDVALSDRWRVEASAFWQDDRVFGDVGDIARDNEGEWGARVARTALVAMVGRAVMRHTLGFGGFDASVRTNAAGTPVHPTTEDHHSTFVWESRIETPPGAGAPWSAGLRAERTRQRYDGPGVDLARLLSPEELSRRGVPQLTPLIADLARARLREVDAMTRVALWAERRLDLTDAIAVQAGLRAETGDRVLSSSVRLAPRIQVRHAPPGSPLSLSAAWGRTWQYSQSIARTDVLRPGLRATEVWRQADDDTPALRTDLLTLGAELWGGTAWLFGATAWLRGSEGILMPLPMPGAIDGERPVVPASGRARGAELSARKLSGRVRGFANYSFAVATRSVGTRTFDVSENRRHVANIGVQTDVSPTWQAGATLRAESGAPYTRITLVEGHCIEGAVPCAELPPVLYGTPGGQRGPAYASLDLMASWTRPFDGWSLSAYAQLRNALGSPNAVTYHSSCVCVEGDVGARLGDRFDRGLPRLPVVGLRVRF